MRSLRRFAWAVVAWNVAVIAWGAFVRATGSGAGCGRHWPTCRGEIVPRAPALETVIEFTHRATSGLALLAVLALLVAARRALPPGHAARRAALAGAVLVCVEALLGAALVLFGWVARDASPSRGWVMALHLTNTLLLLGALALVAAWAEAPPGPIAPGGWRRALPVAAAAGLLLLAGASGAVAALGDTLYPAASLDAGLRQDLDPSARLLLRLRLLHPVVALAAAGAVAWAARARGPEAAGAAAWAGGLALAQVLGGVLNLVLLAPVWMQLLHLVLADATWIALVVLGARVVAPGAPPGSRPG